MHAMEIEQPQEEQIEEIHPLRRNDENVMSPFSHGTERRRRRIRFYLVVVVLVVLLLSMAVLHRYSNTNNDLSLEEMEMKEEEEEEDNSNRPVKNDLYGNWNSLDDYYEDDDDENFQFKNQIFDDDVEEEEDEDDDDDDDQYTARDDDDGSSNPEKEHNTDEYEDDYYEYDDEEEEDNGTAQNDLIDDEDDYYDHDNEEHSTTGVTLQDGQMYEIQQQLSHNKMDFTQGLTYSKSTNTLYQSNGLYHKSNICRLDPSTGETIQCVDMDPLYFGEGMQVYGTPGEERLIQITWKARRGFVYDAATLETLEEFTFETTRQEGWGICYDQDSNEFIVSDGSEYLHFWDANDRTVKRRVEVTRQNGIPAKNLNELEFVNGKVLANVWFQDVILVIDPISGECTDEYDFSSLYPKRERMSAGADVLNGISISDEDGVLFVTGKKWDRMFKIRLNSAR